MNENVEKQRQLNLLKWLSIALFLNIVFLNVFPFAFYVQKLLFYFALIKCLSYFNGKTPARFFILIAIFLLLANIVLINMLTIIWHLVIVVIVELLIILEFGKIVEEIERKYNLHGSTSRIMKKYKWIMLGIAASWGFLMNMEYLWMASPLIVGAVLMFILNIRLLFHLRSLKKHIKLTMKVVTYS